MRGRGRDAERRRERRNRGGGREEERRNRERGGGRGREEEWRRKTGREEEEERKRGGRRERGIGGKGQGWVGTHLTSLREALCDDWLETSNLLLCHLHLLDAHRAVLHEQIGRSSRDGGAVRLLARLVEGVVLGVVFCEGVGKDGVREDPRQPHASRTCTGEKALQHPREGQGCEGAQAAGVLAVWTFMMEDQSSSRAQTCFTSVASVSPNSLKQSMASSVAGLPTTMYLAFQ
jgi:hypothetical protein